MNKAPTPAEYRLAALGFAQRFVPLSNNITDKEMNKIYSVIKKEASIMKRAGW